MDVLSTLTPRKEKVLKLRFGIEDGRTRTLEEVGKEFNVTRERIRQIEAKALRSFGIPPSKKLKDFLNDRWLKPIAHGAGRLLASGSVTLLSIFSPEQYHMP